jgi:hypothetical protein
MLMVERVLFFVDVEKREGLVSDRSETLCCKSEKRKNDQAQLVKKKERRRWNEQ